LAWRADRTGYDLLLSGTTSTRSVAQAAGGLLRDRCETLILVSPSSALTNNTRLAVLAPSSSPA
jgi:hypothetical protein